MNDPVIILLILIAVGVVGLLILAVLSPVLFQVGVSVEAFNVLAEGLDEYFGRPGLFRSCCLILSLVLVGCCALSVLSLIAFVTCFTESPVALCRLIGR